MNDWTPSLVEARLAEAAFVLKRLPEPRQQGYFNAWPEYFHSFADKVGQEPKPMRVLPSPQAISRMEETLTWTACLEPTDGKIVWMKAQYHIFESVSQILTSHALIRSIKPQNFVKPPPNCRVERLVEISRRKQEPTWLDLINKQEKAVNDSTQFTVLPAIGA